MAVGPSDQDLSPSFTEAARQLRLALAWKCLAVECAAATGDRSEDWRRLGLRVEELVDLVTRSEWTAGVQKVLKRTAEEADGNPDTIRRFNFHESVIEGGMLRHQVASARRQHHPMDRRQKGELNEGRQCTEELWESLWIVAGLHDKQQSPVQDSAWDTPRKIPSTSASGVDGARPPGVPLSGARAWIRIAEALAEWGPLRVELDELVRSTAGPVPKLIEEIDSFREELKGRIGRLEDWLPKLVMAARGGRQDWQRHREDLTCVSRMLDKVLSELPSLSGALRLEQARRAFNDANDVVESLSASANWPPLMMMRAAESWGAAVGRPDAELFDQLEIPDAGDVLERLGGMLEKANASEKIANDISNRCCLVIAAMDLADRPETGCETAETGRKLAAELCAKLLVGTGYELQLICDDTRYPSCCETKPDRERRGLPPVLETTGLMLIVPAGEGKSSRQGKRLRSAVLRKAPQCSPLADVLAALKRRLVGTTTINMDVHLLAEECDVVAQWWEATKHVEASPNPMVASSGFRKTDGIDVRAYSAGEMPSTIEPDKLQIFLLQVLALCEEPDVTLEANRVLLEFESNGVLLTSPPVGEQPTGGAFIVLPGRRGIASGTPYKREQLVGLEILGRSHVALRLCLVGPAESRDLGPIGRLLWEHQQRLFDLEAFWPGWTEWPQIRSWQKGLIPAPDSRSKRPLGELLPNEQAAGLSLLALFHGGQAQAPAAARPVLNDLARLVAERLTTEMNVDLIPSLVWEQTGLAEFPLDIEVELLAEDPPDGRPWTIQKFGTRERPGTIAVYVGSRPPAKIATWMQAPFSALSSPPLDQVPALVKLRECLMQWGLTGGRTVVPEESLKEHFRNWTRSVPGRDWLRKFAGELTDKRAAAWRSVLHNAGWIVWNEQWVSNAIIARNRILRDQSISERERSSLQPLAEAVESECLGFGGDGAETALLEFLRGQLSNDVLTHAVKLAEILRFSVRPIWTRCSGEPTDLRPSELDNCPIQYATDAPLGEYSVQAFEVVAGQRVVQQLRISQSAGPQPADLDQFLDCLHAVQKRGEAETDALADLVQQGWPASRVKGEMYYHEQGVRLFEVYNEVFPGMPQGKLLESLQSLLQSAFGWTLLYPAESFDRGEREWMDVQSDRRRTQGRDGRVIVLRPGLYETTTQTCVLKANVDLETA